MTRIPRLLFAFFMWLSINMLPPTAMASDAYRIGLDADMSSASAQSGEAIRRGMAVAIDELNAAGGVLGKPLQLVVKDHRGNPARGVDNIEDFAQQDDVIAVMGGLHTPVAMAELKAIHANNLIFLVPWAAGTAVVDNGYSPNNVFRVSVRDQLAGRFLVERAQKRGYDTIGLLLEQTGWGRSNEAALNRAAQALGMTIANVQWFSWGTKNLTQKINTLRASGAQAIVLVANTREGAVAVRNIAQMPAPQRLPILSHWGITGGTFPAMLADDLNAVDLSFLQTYSFLRPTRPDAAKAFLARYDKLFPGQTQAGQRNDILSPAGTAHAYDLVMLLARAADQAGSVDPDRLRQALENQAPYDGLVKRYTRPFTAARHDALKRSDFTLAEFSKNGAIVPIER